MRHAALLTILLLFAASLRGEAEKPSAGYTNHAGIVLQAEPEAIEKGRVRFRKPDGSTLTIPLAAFPEAEQTRIRETVSPSPVPEGLRIARQRHQSALNRVALLHKQGRLTDAERAEAEARYHALWAKRVARFEAEQAEAGEPK